MRRPPHTRLLIPDCRVVGEQRDVCGKWETIKAFMMQANSHIMHVWEVRAATKFKWPNILQYKYQTHLTENCLFSANEMLEKSANQHLMYSTPGAIMAYRKVCDVQGGPMVSEVLHCAGGLDLNWDLGKEELQEPRPSSDCMQTQHAEHQRSGRICSELLHIELNAAISIDSQTDFVGE